MSSDKISQRKQAHLDLCLEEASQSNSPLFSMYALPYKALPEIDLQKVTTTTKIFNKPLSQPLIIASMTGGVAHAKSINTNLAIAAEEMQVAMGVGSQRITLVNDGAKETFELVRKHAPTTVIFANMGAVQLNYGHGIDSYQRVVDMIKADGLYLHINALQEALQPEGDTNFTGLLDKIGTLIKKISVPVFIKEVGHGLDPKTAQVLVDMGAAGIDCAGVGGTSWAWVEAKRANKPLFESWFKDFGIQSDELIVSYQSIKNIKKVISGGVRSPIEVVKARALGVDYYSLAQPFLQPSLKNVESVKNLIADWQRGLQITLFACGCASWESARKLDLIKK